jgi:hypothetical protein
MTYEEGTNEIIFFRAKNMKFDKITPEFSKRLPFTTFPYNSRYCNIKKENKIIISGGIGAETSICSYDYDINYLMELPNLTNEHQLHSMVQIDDNIYIIGGNNSKSVECLNLEFEDYSKVPDLNYDRKDPSVCVINNRYIYVFMGYSSLLSETTRTYELLDIEINYKWELINMKGDDEFYLAKLSSGVLPVEGGFLFLGGFCNGSCKSEVVFFDILDNYFKISDIYKHKLPFETAFGEKQMFTFNDSDYYLFTYGSMQLIKFDKEKNALVEIIKI